MDMKQHYEITISGHLTPNWTAFFEGMDIHCKPDGTTLLSGMLPDQPALYGILLQLRDLGFTLISVHSDMSQQAPAKAGGL
jgi:hypothetical protein